MGFQRSALDQVAFGHPRVFPRGRGRISRSMDNRRRLPLLEEDDITLPLRSGTHFSLEDGQTFSKQQRRKTR